MMNRLRHRGPDADGVWAAGPVALGHTRLSIIDLSPRGSQPMTNEDGRLTIVFNGEIYNYQEIRRGLLERGHRFKSETDTEVILHLYEEKGAGCLDALRGMFAFAICDRRDSRQGSLFLARDRLGKKPLVYARDSDRFIFASEIRALTAALPFAREPDFAALNQFLTYGYIPAPLTAFRGVFKLPAAHCATVSADGQVKIERYWRLDYSRKERRSEDEWAERIRAELAEATRLRMISDVPLGAFLSGGIDSSAVVALMAEHAPAGSSGGGSSGRVKTFSVGFREKRYDETRFARMVAERFDTDHTEIIVDPDPAILPELVRAYGEPFGDSSAIPSYYVARETRRSVTVALNGDGGDEAFAGYQRYIAYNLAERLPLPAFLRPAVGAAGSLLPDGEYKSLLRKLKGMAPVLAETGWRRYLKLVEIFSDELRREVFGPGIKRLTEPGSAGQGSDPTGLLADLFGPDSPSGLDRLLQADVAYYLPDDLLVKVDIASMLNSLEARSPFLDHKVMELAARIPPDLKLKGAGGTKHILKRAFRGILPDEVLDREKMGFSVPLDHWFRGQLKPMLEEYLLAAGGEPGLLRLGFDPAPVKRLAQEHLDGRRDHKYRLYLLLVAVLWGQSL